MSNPTHLLNTTGQDTFNETFTCICISPWSIRSRLIRLTRPYRCELPFTKVAPLPKGIKKLSSVLIIDKVSVVYSSWIRKAKRIHLLPPSVMEISQSARYYWRLNKISAPFAVESLFWPTIYITILKPWIPNEKISSDQTTHFIEMDGKHVDLENPLRRWTRHLSQKGEMYRAVSDGHSGLEEIVAKTLLNGLLVLFDTEMIYQAVTMMVDFKPPCSVWFEHHDLLVSAHVLCERLSVMQKPGPVWRFCCQNHRIHYSWQRIPGPEMKLLMDELWGKCLPKYPHPHPRIGISHGRLRDFGSYQEITQNTLFLTPPQTELLMDGLRVKA